MVASVMEMTMDQLSANEGGLVDDLVRKMGIFSVSSIGISQPMWGLYASAGAGFFNSSAIRDWFYYRARRATGERALGLHGQIRK
jgi:hypothetical protein